MECLSVKDGFICGLFIEHAVDAYVPDCIFQLVERKVQEIGMRQKGQRGCLVGEKSEIVVG